jgi:hypothetical protein
MGFMQDFAMERSRNDVEYFYKWLGYTWGGHIGEWMDMYGDRKGAQVQRVCVIAPRDHSKSTTLRIKLLHKCLFEKWRDKPMTIWLFSASKDLATRRLEEIREDLKRHPQLSRYLDNKRGNKLELRLTNGSWIRATSVGAAIRGEHPACIAFDDVLDDSGDTNWNEIRNWFRKKITPMLSPGTSLYVVGTPLSMNDLYHTEMIGNKTWTTGVWSAIPNWDEHRADPDNVKPKPLWGEYRPIDFLLEQKEAMGELSFVQEYLCRVVDDEAAVFPRGQTRKNLQMERVLGIEKQDDWRYVLGFDPAHGVGQDYSVIVCLAQDPEGYVHFVNMWRRNDFPPDKQADMLVEWSKRFSAPIAAEDVGFQQLYESILIQKGAVVDYRKSKASNRTLKQGLMNRLRVWFEREMVCFPYGDDETRRLVSILLEELETHAWRNGLIVDLGKHNDCVMAFAHAIDQFTYKKQDMPVIMTTMSGGAWLGGGQSKIRRDFGGAGGKVINRRRF